MLTRVCHFSLKIGLVKLSSYKGICSAFLILHHHISHSIPFIPSFSYRHTLTQKENCQRFMLKMHEKRFQFISFRQLNDFLKVGIVKPSNSHHANKYLSYCQATIKKRIHPDNDNDRNQIPLNDLRIFLLDFLLFFLLFKIFTYIPIFLYCICVID